MSIPKLIPKKAAISPPQLVPKPLQTSSSETLSKDDQIINTGSLNLESSKLNKKTEECEYISPDASPKDGHDVVHNNSCEPVSLEKDIESKLSSKNLVVMSSDITNKSESLTSLPDAGNHINNNMADVKKYPSNKSSPDDDVNDIGYTSWLNIERKINQIRSLLSNDMKTSKSDQKSNGKSLCSNYNSAYEEDTTWKKEVDHPLNYSMLKKIDQKVPKRDNWKFIDGLLRPRRKPFTSMAEMSKYFSKIQPTDQYDLIKLLLACRDLEKVIEEQQTVINMLDHDLREARQMIPESLPNIACNNLIDKGPEEPPFYPTSDAPLFVKGRLYLLPKDNAVS